MNTVNFTADEQAKVDSLLARIMAGGIHRKDVRREVTDYQRTVFHLRGQIDTSRPTPIMRREHYYGHDLDIRGRQEQAQKVVARIAECERKIAMGEYLLAHGKFPKGYRR